VDDDQCRRAFNLAERGEESGFGRSALEA
jgi:hypothetical protein